MVAGFCGLIRSVCGLDESGKKNEGSNVDGSIGLVDGLTKGVG